MRSRNPDAPLFDLLSYGRRGPERRVHLSPTQIARTAQRTPEVMVKVLPAGTGTLGGVCRHLDYIGRHGDVDLETDDGQELRGRDVAGGLLEDWDLDLEEHRRQSGLSAAHGRPPRLVYKVVFSMPAGTAPEKVHSAVRNFCREQFALQHRYVLALHTDEPHPHVHAVIKAASEQGRRLNLKKATLRGWREEFARHLRAAGVAAKATPRFVRGETTPRKSDGIYRAGQRGESTHLRQRVEAAAAALLKRDGRAEPAKLELLQRRQEVERKWRVVADILPSQGQRELAAQTRRYADALPPPETEREWLMARLLERTREPRRQEQSTR
ncbi:MAG: relaxase/mobilization nuclease domain-containing protein [Steroidobacteraceae bacterium]